MNWSLWVPMLAIIGGSALGYLLHVAKTRYDYKTEVYRRKLNLYEEFCRNTLFAGYNRFKKTEDVFAYFDRTNALFLYCSSEIFNKIFNMNKKITHLVIKYGVNSKPPDEKMDEIVSIRYEILTLMRKDIKSLKLRKLKEVDLRPPDLTELETHQQSADKQT